MNQKIELSAQALAANGNATFTIPYMNAAGLITAYVSGTWGGGSAKLQVSPDGTLWLDAVAAITADGKLALSGVLARKVRVNLAGATSPALTVNLLF